MAGSFPCMPGGDVPVDVAGDRDGGVAETLLDDLERDTGPEHQGRVGVTQTGSLTHGIPTAFARRCRAAAGPS